MDRIATPESLRIVAMIRRPSFHGEDRQFDMRIEGQGIALMLVATAILQARPDLSLLLVTDDEEPGGASLELILPGSLPASLVRLFGACQVASWKSYNVHGRDGIHCHEEEVWLIDPVQAWLELTTMENPPRFLSRTDADAIDTSPGTGAQFCHSYGHKVRLPVDQFKVTDSKIVGSNFLKALKEPVFADFSLSKDGDQFLQYVPLGDERVAIRTVDAAVPIENETDIAKHMSTRWSIIEQICQLQAS